MKRLLSFLISGALVAGSAGSLSAQQPDKDTGVKGAVKDVGKGAKKAGEATGKAAKETGKTVKKGTKKAAKGTKKGAEKVGDTVNPKNW